MRDIFKYFRLDKAGEGDAGGAGGGAGAASGGGTGGGLGLADGGTKGAGGAAGDKGGDKGGSAGAGAGAGDAGKGAPADKGGAGDWRSGLPEAIRGSKSLEKFKDPTALAQSYLSLEQNASKKGVVVPGDQAPQEEWDAFYKAIGRPEAADKYDLKNPDGISLKIDENFQKGFKETAHKLGVSAKAASGLYQWYLTEGDGRVKAGIEKQRGEISAGVDALKKDWGEKFAGNVNDAKIAIDAVVPDDLKKWFKDTGLSENPNMARIFHNMASKFMSEDQLREGGDGTVGTTIQDLEKELLDLNAPSGPRYGKDDTKKDWANNRSIEIRKELTRLKGKAS